MPPFDKEARMNRRHYSLRMILRRLDKNSIKKIELVLRLIDLILKILFLILRA
jgi:hypothetical protein